MAALVKAPSAEVVLLAAGRSSRMGEPKGLVDVDGRPWLLHQLDALGDRRVVVVLGYDCEPYRSIVPASPCVVIADNLAPERGPFSSVQTGLARVTPGVAAFVLPIDVPVASPAVWSALERALASSDGTLEAAVPTYGDGQVGEARPRGGHPVLLAPAFVATVLAAPIDASARLDRYLGLASAAGRVARVAVDDARVRFNLNTPEDWEKFQARRREGRRARCARE